MLCGESHHSVNMLLQSLLIDIFESCQITVPLPEALLVYIIELSYSLNQFHLTSDNLQFHFTVFDQLFDLNRLFLTLCSCVWQSAILLSKNYALEMSSCYT